MIQVGFQRHKQPIDNVKFRLRHFVPTRNLSIILNLLQVQTLHSGIIVATKHITVFKDFPIRFRHRPGIVEYHLHLTHMAKS